jgi:hypothetical protein
MLGFDVQHTGVGAWHTALTGAGVPVVA